jgi:hypothetical protein
MGRTHDVVISGFDLDALERELQAERALADRLAIHLEDTLSGWITDKCFRPEPYEAALAAWKEARND